LIKIHEDGYSFEICNSNYFKYIRSEVKYVERLIEESFK